jgi:hypothetical protein
MGFKGLIDILSTSPPYYPTLWSALTHENDHSEFTTVSLIQYVVYSLVICDLVA